MQEDRLLARYLIHKKAEILYNHALNKQHDILIREEDKYSLLYNKYSLLCIRPKDENIRKYKNLFTMYK